MKKIYLFIFLFSFFVSANAQKIRFTDLANNWNSYADGMAWYENPGHSHSINYQYWGDTIINGNSYSLLTASGFIIGNWFSAAREDTVAGKVYIRRFGQDTADVLLYDYNLVVGDTFYSVVDSSLYAVVDSLYSTVINGIVHKVWEFSNPALMNGQKYTVVEGLGCVEGFLIPLDPEVLEYTEILTCFANGAASVTLHPAIVVDHYFDVAFTFDNDTSCLYHPAGVDNINANTKTVSVVPNPTNVLGKIAFSDNIESGSVVIYDVLGKVVVNKQFANKSEYSFGATDFVPGVYFYRVVDSKCVKAFTGKFVFE